MTTLQIIVYAILLASLYPLFNKVVDNLDKWYKSKVDNKKYIATNFIILILIIVAFIYVVLIK